MILAIVLFVLVWFSVMAVLLTPTITYTSLFDRLTKARYRDDRVPLQVMLDHLRSFPEQWSISRDSVSFPKEGSKDIYLSLDDKGQWKYSLTSTGGKSRPLVGHFGSEFDVAIKAENSRRETEGLLRRFYPELNQTLMLEKYS